MKKIGLALVLGIAAAWPAYAQFSGFLRTNLAAPPAITLTTALFVPGFGLFNIKQTAVRFIPGFGVVRAQ